MKYIIDTSILIEIENNNQKIIEEINTLKKAPLSEISITLFSFCEFYYGAMEKNAKNKEIVKERLQQYRIITPTIETGIKFCEMMYALEKKGKKIAEFDAFIAAQAIENDSILITADKGFTTIPELKSILLHIEHQ